MNKTFEKLEVLSDKAKKDPALKKKLLATKSAPDPMDAFCKAAEEAGVSVSVGELFALGQEYSDDQCKSTNGGNPTPYAYFEDACDTFLSSLK